MIRPRTLLALPVVVGILLVAFIISSTASSESIIPRAHAAAVPTQTVAATPKFDAGDGGIGGTTLIAKQVTYASPNGLQLTGTIYRMSKTTNGKMIMLVHGGGWWMGDTTEFTSTLRGANNTYFKVQLAQSWARAGYVTMVVNYRLACGTPDRPRYSYGYSYTVGANHPNLKYCNYNYNHQVLDLVSAMRWMRANGRSYGGNPSKIAALGTSAGGHLVTSLLKLPRASDRPNAVIAWGSPVSTDYIEVQDPKRYRSLKPGLANTIGCQVQICRAKWSAANPSRMALGTAVTKPPVLLSVSQREPQVDEPDMLLAKKRLAAKGYKTQGYIMEGTCHALACWNKKIVGGPSAGKTLYQMTNMFLAKSY